jgi:hypothetical protein
LAGAAGGGVAADVQEESSSFLKKRTKKLLFPVGYWLEEHATAHKSFLLLFLKKEGLS